jgi:tRNA pseudouridine38-40 synthase
VYVVLNRAVPSALLARYAWFIREPLDLVMMKQAGSELIGTHDFATFGMPDKPGRSTIRRVFDIRIMRRRDALFLAIRANAFLRGMARTVVGALVEVGLGRRSPDEVVTLLEACNRRCAKVIAPSRGLYLTKVEY